MIGELSIFVITLVAVIVTEYVNYSIIIKNTVKCYNLNYLSNTLKYDIDGIIKYVAGVDVELRVGRNLKYSSIHLPLKPPTIIADIDMLFNTQLSNINIICLIHEACHIANKSSLKFLAAKTIIIPNSATICFNILKNVVPPTSVVLIALILLTTYALLHILNTCDERSANSCLSNYVKIDRDHTLHTLKVYKISS
ncbi:MAG: hypothetical protein QXH57_02185 [Sulfolobales archaeon]